MTSHDHRRDDRERRTPAARQGTARPAGTAAGSGLTDLRHAALALQRTLGNAAASRVIARWREAVPGAVPDLEAGASPGQVVHDVLRSPGRPLDTGVRGEMEARLGADFSTVRLHTGPAASRSAAQLDASAYTVGENVVLGGGPADHTTLAHELSHVIQQRHGPVSGGDIGGGLRVSDPADSFERAAEDNARRVMSGPVPEHPATTGENTPNQQAQRDPHVQRFVVVYPGQANYPLAGSVDQQGNPSAVSGNFFPAQVPNQQGSYVTGGVLNLRYLGPGQAPLRISQKLDLAVEETTDGAQAKTFFATEDRIAKANDKLSSIVSFQAARNHLELRRSRRFLRFKLPDRELRLWQVEPVVVRPPRPGGTELRVQTGLDVRLAQRCNEMATAVTGRQGLAEAGERRYFDAAADILGAITDTSANRYRRRLDDARRAASTDASAANVQALTDIMKTMIGTIMQFRDEPNNARRLNQLVGRFHLNEYARSPAVGEVMMIKALDANAQSGGLDFHFAGVVATSGGDYITMENFARHESTATLSGGDPQWYFAMYGTEESVQTWHEQWGWGSRADLSDRLTFSITISG
jgi:hypothetical protein